MHKCTIAAALAAVTLTAAWAAGGVEAQARHGLEGAWSGRDAKGTTIEVIVEKVLETGKIEGRWCFQYANKGILGGTLDKARLEDPTTMRWRPGRRVNQLTLKDAGQRRAEWAEVRSAGTKPSPTPMRPMRSMRCSDRFVFEGEHEVKLMQLDDAPVLGAWSGVNKHRKREGAALFTSVDDQGRILEGRYCRRWTATGMMDVFDIGPGQAAFGQMTPDGRSVKVTMPWRNGQAEHTFTLDDKGVMRVKSRGPWEGGTKNTRLERGLREEGCLQRTTPTPAERSRRLSG